MTIDKLPMTPSTTIRSDEVARFNRLAATWWNRTGPMRPLHVVNELRLGHVLEQIAQRFERPVGALQGLRIADVGCGAGLMCEPLAARGALVVGIDAAANNIAAARLHSKAAGLPACGLTPGERRGMGYLPAIHRAWWTRGLSVNYIASFGKPGNATP